jgi:hypothetical protein
LCHCCRLSLQFIRIVRILRLFIFISNYFAECWGSTIRFLLRVIRNFYLRLLDRPIFRRPNSVSKDEKNIISKLASFFFLPVNIFDASPWHCKQFSSNLIFDLLWLGFPLKKTKIQIHFLGCCWKDWMRFNVNFIINFLMKILLQRASQWQDSNLAHRNFISRKKNTVLWKLQRMHLVFFKKNLTYFTHKWILSLS